MSHIAKGIFGAAAVSLVLGAVQFASGHDLTGRQALGGTAMAGTPDSTINRATKADRVSGATGAAASTRTIALRLDSLADTSVLIRVPVAKEARNAPAATKSGGRKMTVACEPVVSVLAEIARQLQPGRCVT
jgi:hypothetical protein